MHSSLKSDTTALGKPRTRWPDYLHRMMNSEAVYECPDLSDRQRADFSKPWAHNTAKTYGGYGYNFQYLGNARHWPDNSHGAGAPRGWNRPFHAQASQIKRPAGTLAVADTRGSKKGDPDRRFGQGGAGVYVIDPPLGSYKLGSEGSRKNKSDIDTKNLWYEGGTDISEEELVRSGPDARHHRRVTAAFCDGHAEAMLPGKLDGRIDGSAGDNRYYNGLMSAAVR
jgi:prepilin-type processing-associated H-X9-DG protein